jgi:hypothetical protein
VFQVKSAPPSSEALNDARIKRNQKPSLPLTENVCSDQFGGINCCHIGGLGIDESTIGAYDTKLKDSVFGCFLVISCPKWNNLFTARNMTRNWKFNSCMHSRTDVFW